MRFSACNMHGTPVVANVTSPNYPANYPIDYESTTTLSVDQSQVVAVQFDDFQLEYSPLYDEYYYYYYDENTHPGYEDIPCIYDWLRVN